jgi:hypothetical protein
MEAYSVKKLKLWASILFIIGAWSFAVIHTAQYICNEYKQASDKDCSAYKVASSLIIRGGDFLDDHNGDINALSAVVIAYFTSLLWRVSRDQHATSIQATRLAANTIDIATKEAMPYLYPVLTEINLYPIGEVDDGTMHRPQVRIEFKNIGRTPALLRSAGVHIILTDADQLPSKPPPQEFFMRHNEDSIGPGEKAGPTTSWSYGGTIDAEQIRGLNRKYSLRPGWFRFFVYGVVVYDDFFGTRHTRRFNMKVRQEGLVAFRGGEQWNAVYREKTPDDPKAAAEET